MSSAGSWVVEHHRQAHQRRVAGLRSWDDDLAELVLLLAAIFFAARGEVRPGLREAGFAATSLACICWSSDLGGRELAAGLREVGLRGVELGLRGGQRGAARRAACGARLVEVV